MSGPRSTVLRLLVLARPRGAVLITALPLVGFGYALWERGSTITLVRVAPTLGLLAASWVLGHAGAMWLNAALDRDRGPVLLGRPVEVPASAPMAGYAALLASVGAALFLGVVPFVCALVCAVLAVVYSHPRAALKGSAIGGPLVNGVGYGSLSPLAGWAAADPVLTWRAPLTLGLSVAFILGTYFAAQAFQGEEDARRGYRTLVVTHGPAWTLGVAHACLRLAVIGMLAASVAGAYPRLLLASLPVWLAAERHLEAWRETPAADRAGGLVGRLALGTLATVVTAYAHHFWLLAQDRPGGGCGTALVPEALGALCE
jgi:4-hydroxybenzoate polyprenyltransferase